MIPALELCRRSTPDCSYNLLLTLSVQYIDDALPPESPHLYGLHPNAEIGFLTQRSEQLLRTVLELQPRDGSAGEGGVGTREETVRARRGSCWVLVPVPCISPVQLRLVRCSVFCLCLPKAWFYAEHRPGGVYLSIGSNRAVPLNYPLHCRAFIIIL